ncbi:MAG: hypothetical protein Q8936_16785 [Bacillota bacterium]|nr:hypothetical protein [Bacillota bacterium]
MKIQLEGMEDILNKVKELSTGREFEECNKGIIKKTQQLAKDKMRPRVPNSLDNSMSGRKGYRPNGHAKDNIPVSKIKNKKGYFYGSVGWETGDTSEYFYIKFVNYGTSKMKPKAFIQQTYDEIEKPLDQIAIEEYENLIRKLGE